MPYNGKLSMAKLFIVSAPSGAGKTSLVHAVVAKMYPEYPLARVVTYTTKPQGAAEVQGVDYHYIGEQEFKAKIAEGFFLEWSDAYGHLYGSPRTVLDDLAQGVSLFLILDRAGAKAVAAQVPGAVLIWIMPPDMQTLEHRLKMRARDNQTTIDCRLLLATAELKDEQNQPLFTYQFINEQFEESCDKLEQIVKCEIDRNNFKK
jgi:guanylate kinase